MSYQSNETKSPRTSCVRRELGFWVLIIYVVCYFLKKQIENHKRGEKKSAWLNFSVIWRLIGRENLCVICSICRVTSWDVTSHLHKSRCVRLWNCVSTTYLEGYQTKAKNCVQSILRDSILKTHANIGLRNRNTTEFCLKRLMYSLK